MEALQEDISAYTSEAFFSTIKTSLAETIVCVDITFNNNNPMELSNYDHQTVKMGNFESVRRPMRRVEEVPEF